MKDNYKNIIDGVISIFVVMLINYNLKSKVSLFSFILGIGIFFLFKNYKKDKISVITFINAFLFALFLEIGVCYQKGTSLAYLWKNINNFLIGIMSIIVFTCLFYLLLDFLFNKFQNMKNAKPKSKILNFIFEEHPFFSTFIITLSISLFYLIFFYPGAMSYDGLWQLDVYNGINVIAENHPPIVGFSDHHPAVVTLIMGFLMNLGRNLVNDNFGMFLFVLPQLIINALVYAYVLKIMKKMNTPFSIRVVSLLFYSAFPLLVMYSITFIKDTIFYLMFLFLVVYIYYHFRVDYKKENKRKFLVIAFGAFILYLTKNTGFYIMIITFLCLMFYFRKKEKFVSISFGCLIVLMILLNIGYKKVFLVKMNIKPASIREIMSVPLQQTGRYLKYYSNDLTNEEKEVLGNLFSVDLKKVGKLYQVYKSDNIKWIFKEYPNNEEIKDYIRVWFSMFLKHPFIYFDATLNNIYGYFYPNVINFVGEEIGFYYIDVDGPVNTGEFDLHWNNLGWGRNILQGIALKISKTDGLKLLYTPAFYMWLFISSVGYLMRNKKKQVLYFLTPLFIVGFSCLISPVNAHMRYLQPVMVSIPFVLAIMHYETKKI